MRIGFSRDDEAFRADVKRYFAQEYPKDILAKVEKWSACGSRRSLSLAAGVAQKRVVGAKLAEGIWRTGLDAGAAIHL